MLIIADVVTPVDVRIVEQLDHEVIIACSIFAKYWISYGGWMLIVA